MRGKTILAGLVVILAAAVTSAQGPVVPSPNELYCSGTVTTESVPRDTYVITGEESNYRLLFNEGDQVYINKGASQGVKVGDVFSVIRNVTGDPYGIDWSKWQSAILKKMGSVWTDEGRVRVTAVLPDTSIGRLEHSCDYVQRGDILLPFAARPAPPLKAEDSFDHFAPANGKPMAMVIAGKDFQDQVGREDIVYVNLGSAQGVKIGDYFRIFRYTGTQHETVFQDLRYAFDQEDELHVAFFPIYGFGSAPKKYDWSNTPREDVGEGIVLRTGPNSSTVLITFSLREIYPGDYVELE